MIEERALPALHSGRATSAQVVDFCSSDAFPTCNKFIAEQCFGTCRIPNDSISVG